MAQIISFLTRIENGILVTMLLAMILMAVLQIVLRNLFDTGIVFSESLVRILVLWVMLIGAMMASRQDKHIRLEVLIHYVPVRWQHFIKLITEVFAATICFGMAYFSFQFVQQEFQYGGEAFAGVPNWICESIIPFAFFVIAWRYLLLSLMHMKTLERSRA